MALASMTYTFIYHPADEYIVKRLRVHLFGLKGDGWQEGPLTDAAAMLVIMSADLMGTPEGADLFEAADSHRQATHARLIPIRWKEFAHDGLKLLALPRTGKAIADRKNDEDSVLTEIAREIRRAFAMVRRERQAS